MAADRAGGRVHADVPVAIIGAGPAGLACAIVLARAGRRVVVYDRRPVPGGRFHGDFQGLENWTSRVGILAELAASGIEPDFPHVPVTQRVAFDAEARSYPVRSAAPLYYLVRRGSGPDSLDRALAEQALAAGVDLRLGVQVEAPRPPAVLAIGPRRADAIAVGYVFETDMADGNFICFSEELAPKGYAYLLVAGGRGTVASCMFTGFKNHREHLSRTVAFFRRHAGLAMRNPRPFGGYGNFRMPRTAVQGGRPVIGEQAGFQDSLAGFGMTYALRSGILAARSIIEGVSYTKLWRHHLLPLLRTSIANRYIFNLLGDRGRAFAVASRIATADARDALYRLYHPWWLSRLIYPLARWRYRAPLRDPSCDHVHCGCVWCEHGLAEAAESATPG